MHGMANGTGVHISTMVLPLGSAGNDECQIDSISQSWSVLSGAGNTDRSQIAMESVNKRLVRRESFAGSVAGPSF